MKYLKIPKLTEHDVARFWKHVAKRSPDDCWLWLAGKSDEGYGRFKLDGRLYSATRVAYRIVYGKDPAPKHSEAANGARYTVAQVKYLRRLAQRLPVPEAARMAGVNESSAYSIVRGDTWTLLPVLSHMNMTGRCRA